MPGMWWPAVCAGCGSAGSSPCGPCLDGLSPAPALDAPAGLASLGALLAYDRAARPFVTALKYRNQRGPVDVFAPAMAALLPAGGAAVAEGPPTVVTWAPTTSRRRRQRGFDQAAVLARAVAAHGRRPVRRLLVRRPGGHQTGRSRAQRLSGVSLIARAAAPPVVVVVDDVCTTGATLTAAAEALRAAGAVEVHGLVLARTPAERSAA